MSASTGGNDASGSGDVIATVINFNTAPLSAECVRSLRAAGLARVLVLDNASDVEDVRALDAALRGLEGVRVVRSERNLGFAEGSNRLIDEALADPSCDRVLLINSDATVEAEGLAACLQAMKAQGHDLMGGRMMKPADAGGEVDSLGIAMYKSLLASNRKSPEDAYLGPTGGFAIFSRRFLEEVRRVHGYVFDPSYFCYAEDTDLCVRARLLGFRAGYTDCVVGIHRGQASHGGQYNDFILYHGIRNSIWMVAKSMPGRIILTHSPYILALHAGILARHLRQGRWKTLWRLYRDALAGLPRALRARRLVQSTRRVSARDFAACIDRQFYETRFVKDALKDLVH